RQELFNLAGASHSALVFVGEFFDTENGDDVLQILVALENRLHAASNGVVLGADDARIENARVAGERIDRWVDAAFDDLAAEVGCRVQVREGGGRGGIGVVLGGRANRLPPRGRAAPRGSRALLQFAPFRRA